MDKHTVHPDNASLIYNWLQTRGGLRIWHSIDLSDPHRSMTTPADKSDKPHWKMCNAEACRIITDPDDVLVITPKEVKRFHVALRRSSNGMSMKCTDHSSEKIRKAQDEAGPNSWYVFDYETQEAVILVPDSTMPIKEFMQISDDNHTN